MVSSPASASRDTHILLSGPVGPAGFDELRGIRLLEIAAGRSGFVASELLFPRTRLRRAAGIDHCGRLVAGGHDPLSVHVFPELAEFAEVGVQGHAPTHPASFIACPRCLLG